MVFSKIKKISFILLILFILLFPFWCVRGLCAESVELIQAQGVVAIANSNTFVSAPGSSSNYFIAEKNYKYTITVVQDFQNGRIVVSSSNIPTVGSTYDLLYTELKNAGDYYIVSSANDTYITISSNIPSGYITVTREPLNGQSEAVSSLVDNVGISSIWNIFDISINYIVVVVLFAFGAYIIFRIIRKISRGKEGL